MHIYFIYFFYDTILIKYPATNWEVKVNPTRTPQMRSSNAHLHSCRESCL